MGATPLIFCCKICGDAKEKKQMRSSAICRLCHKERQSDKRSRRVVFKKFCMECRKTADESTFKLRMMPGPREAPEVCGFCYETIACNTCEKPTTRHVAVNGMCDRCQNFITDVAKEKMVEKYKCATCLGAFESLEMLDDKQCLYCALDTHDRERIMAIAERMKSNHTIYSRVRNYIYNRRRLEQMQAQQSEA